jgi:hypothetical protein
MTVWPKSKLPAKKLKYKYISCGKYLISHFVRFIIQKVGSQSDKFRQA